MGPRRPLSASHQRHGVTVYTAEQEDKVELNGGRSHVKSSKIVHVPDFRLSRHFSWATLTACLSSYCLECYNRPQTHPNQRDVISMTVLWTVSTLAVMLHSAVVLLQSWHIIYITQYYTLLLAVREAATISPAHASWPLTFWPWKWCLSHVWRGLPLCQFYSSCASLFST